LSTTIGNSVGVPQHDAAVRGHRIADTPYLSICLTPADEPLSRFANSRRTATGKKIAEMVRAGGFAPLLGRGRTARADVARRLPWEAAGGPRVVHPLRRLLN